MAEAQQKQQQALEEKEQSGDEMDPDDYKLKLGAYKGSKRRSSSKGHSKTIDIDMSEFDDDTSVLDAIRSKLKSTPMATRNPEFELKLGKVLEDKTLSLASTQESDASNPPTEDAVNQENVDKEDKGRLKGIEEEHDDDEKEEMK